MSETTRAPEYSIILAAGSGKRMRSPELHKVCFPIGGVPAISRAVGVYDSCNVRKHVVVVGDKAEQVMQAASDGRTNVAFAFQAEQTGTADAARCGLSALPECQAIPGGDVLVVAGDKVVEPDLLQELFRVYYEEGCDLAFITGDREHGPGLGRIVLGESGAVLGNEEAADVTQRRVLGALRKEVLAGAALRATEVRRRMEEAVGAGKAPVVFRLLWDLVTGAGAEDGAALEPAAVLERIPPEMTRFCYIGAGEDGDAEQVELSPDEVDARAVANQSIYLLKTRLLREALEGLGRDNAQKEEYLSDIVTVLSQGRKADGERYVVRAIAAADRHAVMAFNNPEELLEIEEYLRTKTAGDQGTPASGSAAAPVAGVKSLGAWKELFEAAREGDDGGELVTCLQGLYGDGPAVARERIDQFLAALRHAAGVLGPEAEVLVVRSPGRVNLLGRHVDHQGGNCNLMTIGYETVMIARPRDDDGIRLFSVDPEAYPDDEFSIGEVLTNLPWEDWLSVVNSDLVLDMARKAQGNWKQYVMAAALRLQKRFPGSRLRGADIVVAGDIPPAAGLSSSSALVVGTLETLIAVNNLDLQPTQLVDLAGEGEWFVGTRGGSADHAAIKLGRKGKVVKVSFFDFAVEGVHEFPRDHVLAVCNSGVSAHKSSGARDQFNHRVACYRIGFTLIRQMYPQYAPLTRHLRDVNTRTLRVPLESIYEILLSLPESATRDELRALCGNDSLEPYFETHAEPADGAYPVRGVVLYGLAECERSRRYADLLEAGEIAEIGRLMAASHDGDRVTRLGPDGRMEAYTSPTGDGYLRALIADLRSQDAERVARAQLARQPGSYRCSIPEIDSMADLATGVPGVAGAQLAGAGLGGCMMVMVERAVAADLEHVLKEGYYEPAGREPAILWCEPVAGSGVIRLE